MNEDNPDAFKAGDISLMVIIKINPKVIPL
jgi:hypothetical protein